MPTLSGIHCIRHRICLYQQTNKLFILLAIYNKQTKKKEMAEYNAPVPQVDPVLIEINRLFDEMVFCVNQRREAVLFMYNDLSQDIASRPLVRARREQELTALRAETENLIQMNQNLQFQQRMLSDIDLQLAEIRTPQPDTCVVFRSQFVPLYKLIAELGEVLEEEMPAVPDYPDTKPVITVPDYPDTTPVITVPNYSHMRPVVAVGKRGTAPGELYHPNAVAIDCNNCIFVTEGSSQSHALISVFSQSGEFLASFSHQDMIDPQGVAIHGDNLYVSDREAHSIFHFKTDTNFSLVAKVGTKGRRVGEFNHPRNLAVSNYGDVYVADYNNNRVQIFSCSLHHLRNLTQQPIECPRDIKLTADEVYVLCVDNPCLHVFSHAGEKLRSLLSSGNQMQMNCHSCFCLDSAENIIISDWLSHRILIFTKEGNLITTIGEYGQQVGMLHRPRGIALTKELSLVVVSENENFGLQILSCI